MTTSRRALHWVFKIGDRSKTISFYKDVLGMRVLRHEEFEAGCEATCNGPYDNKWSKTMIGFDHEDTQFVSELTYNYGIGHYDLGNDLRGIHVQSATAVQNLKSGKWPIDGEKDGVFSIKDPDGYLFTVRDGPENAVTKVSIAVSDLKKSLEYWRLTLGMSVFSQTKERIILGYAGNQCKLELIPISEKVVHDTAIGRIAYACSWDDQQVIRDRVKATGGTIINDLIELPTPGKATVRVLILTDPDGYEICFVGDEGYRELSAIDDNGDELLAQAIAGDKSNEWFAKHGRNKQ